MRLFPLPFILLLATSAVLPQSESCDANPRWLLVTVVRADSWLVAASDGLHTYDRERLELVDLCDYDDFSFDDTRFDGRTDSTLITLMDFSVNQELTFRKRLWVKESLQDICRVMKDCEDTTNQPD